MSCSPVPPIEGSVPNCSAPYPSPPTSSAASPPTESSSSSSSSSSSVSAIVLQPADVAGEFVVVADQLLDLPLVVVDRPRAGRSATAPRSCRSPAAPARAPLGATGSAPRRPASPPTARPTQASGGAGVVEHADDARRSFVARTLEVEAVDQILVGCGADQLHRRVWGMSASNAPRVTTNWVE